VASVSPDAASATLAAPDSPERGVLHTQEEGSSVPAPRFKQLKHAYGFDDVAIVPGEVTINPELVEIGLNIGPYHFGLPFIASAMDAVVDPDFALLMHEAGGLGVLNHEGIWTR